mmetsp:Transcript_36057/g.45898  ORF Transcript_36057/g.45898 Transcript_36057/m.45898 type:complete len:147 (+) Transcript_36057:231-671(+)
MLEELGTDEVILRMACIFKFEMVLEQENGPDRVVKQIGVGIVTKCHGNITDPHFELDIQWCPPRVKKTDDIYKDITADMKFDQRYKVSEFLTDEQRWTTPKFKTFCNSSKDCLLVCNLDLTKDGKLRKPKSYQAAKSEIQNYYQSL